MALILLGSERFDTFWTRKGTNAMRHHNSVLHQVLKQVPWSEFDRLVDEQEADKHVRRLTTKSQLVAMLYAQLSGATSLREVEAGLQSHQMRLYHLGAKPAKRSTLADANALRSSKIYSDLLGHMIGLAHRGLRRALADATYLIDSTGLRLDERSSRWARFSSGVCGAKLHVVYDPDADCPIFAAVSTANVNDITPAQEMPVEAGATYVFDLGYYDYRWWAKLDEAGCRIVTRFKKNTPLAVIEELKLPKGSAILSDRIGFLPARWMRCAKFASRRRAARSCAFCPMISMLLPKRSQTCTSAAGPSNCSSAGLSRR